MSNPIKEVYDGFKSLMIGMRITIGQFFKPTITVQYPHESLKMPARFRGHIELVCDPETGKPLCFACKLCERACPSDCITVDGAKLEGSKKKSVTAYQLDFTKCSLCGSCVEACRDGAIRFSREFNLASTTKDEFVMDLFKRLETEAATEVGTPTTSSTPVGTGSTPSPIASASTPVGTTSTSSPTSSVPTPSPTSSTPPSPPISSPLTPPAVPVASAAPQPRAPQGESK